MHAMPAVAPAPHARVKPAHVNMPPSMGDDLRAAGVVLAGLATVAVLAVAERTLKDLPPKGGDLFAIGRPEARRASRQLRASAALLSGAVLADSAMEHDRGNFENPAMFIPLVSSTLSILANVEGLADGGGERMRPTRRALHQLAKAVGIAGLGFHMYNITKRPGGLSWLNLFYAAPFGSPAALTLAGVIGEAAERLDEPPHGRRKMFGLPFGRGLAALTSFGLAGTVAEALLYHYRGSFQDPFMWLPVALPPVAAGLMARAAAVKTRARSWFSRAWLWATALIGVGGVGFHAFGIARAMGGWKNWRQNVLDGPPLPAPPSFSALALAGLAALDLIEAKR